MQRGPGGGPGGPGIRRVGPGNWAAQYQTPVKPKNARKTLARMMGYLRGSIVKITIMLIAVTCCVLAALWGTRLLGQAVDAAAVDPNMARVAQLAVMMVGLYLVNGLMQMVQSLLGVDVAQQTVYVMRQDLFDRIQQLPLRFFDSNTHGEIMSRLVNDVDMVGSTLSSSLASLLTSVINVVGALAFMLFASPALTLAAVITIPLTMLVSTQIAPRTRRMFKRQQETLGELNGMIEETVTGQRVVKLFSQEGALAERFDTYNIELAKVGVKANLLAGIVPPLMNVLNNLSYALVAGVGGVLAVNGAATPGLISSFLLYVRQFTRPINDLANQFNAIQSAIAGMERVFEVLDTAPEMPDAPNATQMQAVRGEVVFDHVTFGYRQDVPVLKDICASVKPGQTIALVGPTGSGKTTIVNLLMRFYEADSGTILIDGVPIGDYARASLRQNIGMVLQDTFLFAGTIRENIRFGRLDASDEEIEQAAHMANADAFIRRMPGGYEAMLTAEGANLSQGQRQLLSIARAILCNPRILILDEATSSVDTRTEVHIQQAMLKLMEGKTSFVIAHRLSTIREADMILVIQDGRISERGTHQALIERNGFYADLYNSQIRKQAV